MYRISEFDLPEELKPPAEIQKEKECFTQSRPRCLGGLLEENLIDEMTRKAEEIAKELEYTGKTRR